METSTLGDWCGDVKFKLFLHSSVTWIKLRKGILLTLFIVITAVHKMNEATGTSFNSNLLNKIETRELFQVYSYNLYKEWIRRRTLMAHVLWA